MENIVYIIGVTLLLSGVGNVVGGIIEDVQLEAGLTDLPDCETIDKEFWKEQCKTIHEIYNETSEKNKFRNQLLGTIIPLVVVVLFIKKSLD